MEARVAESQEKEAMTLTTQMATLMAPKGPNPRMNLHQVASQTSGHSNSSDTSAGRLSTVLSADKDRTLPNLPVPAPARATAKAKVQSTALHQHPALQVQVPSPAEALIMALLTHHRTRL